MGKGEVKNWRKKKSDKWIGTAKEDNIDSSKSRK